jgi:hypothetical protein
MNPVYILVIINLIVGFGIAIPIARLLSEVNNMPERVIRYFAILILIYFVESVAIIIGMGIPVFSVILAFLWGIIWGHWFRSIASPQVALKTSFFMSLYSCLPSASFISIPFIIWIERGGRYILNVKEAINFGIPEFLPWPMNTILGFYITIVIGAVVFKTVMTTGEVSLLIHLKKNT